MDSADEAMVVVDTTGSIALVNGRAEQLFGYSRQELLGHNIKMLVPQRFHENHDAHCKSYTGHPRLREMGSGVQILGCRRNGTEFPAEISLSPVDIGGEPFVSAAIRDITDNKRLEFLASHFVAVIEFVTRCDHRQGSRRARHQLESWRRTSFRLSRFRNARPADLPSR